MDRELRNCVYCKRYDTFELEDEYHFITRCTLYDEIRMVHIPQFTSNNYCQFVRNMKDTRHLFAVAKFVQKAFRMLEAFLERLECTDILKSCILGIL